MLGGILTTAELPAMAWPNRDDKGCPEGCFVCQENCPAGAIDRQGEVDRLACIKRSMKSPIFSYFMKTKAFDTEDEQMINHVTGVDDHSMYTCIKCVSTCPLWLKAIDSEMLSGGIGQPARRSNCRRRKEDERRL
jgi:epoxyqueuosine reductase QueG